MARQAKKKGVGITLYPDDIERIRQSVKPQNQFAVILALSRYVTDGIMPSEDELGESGMVAFAFIFEKVDGALRRDRAKSEKRKQAAEARWEKTRDAGEAVSCEAPEPEGKRDLWADSEAESGITLDLLPPDDGWMRVAQAYEKQLDLLPCGKALDELMSYYDDLGADVVIYAIDETNGKQPAAPYPYLMSILKAYAKRGFKTVDECVAHSQRLEARRNQHEQLAARQKTNTAPDPGDEPRWLD